MFPVYTLISELGGNLCVPLEAQLLLPPEEYFYTVQRPGHFFRTSQEHLVVEPEGPVSEWQGEGSGMLRRCAAGPCCMLRGLPGGVCKALGYGMQYEKFLGSGV